MNRVGVMCLLMSISCIVVVAVSLQRAQTATQRKIRARDGAYYQRLLEKARETGSLHLYAPRDLRRKLIILNGVPSIKEVWIQETTLTEDAFREFRQLPNLETLVLADVSLQGNGFRDLSNVKSLRTLAIIGGAQPGEQAYDLTELRQISVLVLARIKEETLESFIDALRSLDTLQVLVVDRSFEVADLNQILPAVKVMTLAYDLDVADLSIVLREARGHADPAVQ